MNRFSLLLRNLRYFRGVNTAVVVGVAVAAAVLTGALMVGDSVRGSLRDLALRRLGPVDYALVTPQFFPQSLAERLGPEMTPAIIITGGASNDSAAGSNKPRTSNVQIAALGSALAGSDFKPLPRDACLINGELAHALETTSPGASLLLSVPRQSDVTRDAVLDRRGVNDVLNEMTARVGQIDSAQDFFALFNPTANQRAVRNAWVNLRDLQDAMDQPGRVNVLLAHIDNPRISADDLNKRLRTAMTLDDYGLTLSPVGDDEMCFFSRDTYLSPAILAAAKTASREVRVHSRPVTVNLINSVTRWEGGAAAPAAAIHYAVGAGISPLEGDDDLNGQEIALNQWTADQLGAKVGSVIHIDFSMRDAAADVVDASRQRPAEDLTFKVKKVLPMTGIGADPKLPPNYKGLTDAASVADWDPPEGLVIDKKLVTKADEDYWQKYRAAPKIFFSYDVGRKLWGGVFGNVTGIRVPAKSAQEYSLALVRALSPAVLGMTFRPIKAEQLAAAAGGTDFAMFFLMFSFFIIVAAALLVAMLFRLNIEGRSRQTGLMAAIGFSPASLRWFSLAEGMTLALVGGLIGMVGAVGYTWLILLGLRTWWIGAIGTAILTLHIVPLTFAIGLFSSLIVAMGAIFWATWRVGKTAPALLLAGGFSVSEKRGKKGRGRWAIVVGLVAAGAGAALVALAMLRCMAPEAGFGGGALLLIGAMSCLAGIMRPRDHGGASFVGFASLDRLGLKNASRNTARGILSVGLIGFAAFTLITVAAVQQQGTTNPDDRHSETGGYRLILTSAIPLSGDLDTVDGRKLLGITNPNDPIYTGVEFVPLHRWAGQDVSCLNLTKPNSPTILGLPAAVVAGDGFVHGDIQSPRGHFLSVLYDHMPEGQIPVIVDSDTLEYVLQQQLGDVLEVTDATGLSRKLKIVATIAHSIFQGQVLMSDENFQALFPTVSGFNMVLMDFHRLPPAERAARAQDIARELNSRLDVYSVNIESTDALLRTYQQVQNTYLQTFQTLGALGLMLGTIGLAVVLVRTVIERKSELALLACLGFTSARRVRLVLAENAYLLVLGLILGAGSAVIGILPAVVRESRPLNVISLLETLAAVLVIGLASSIIAVRVSGMHVSPADLRQE